jgi:hypothetical protein
MMTPILPVFTVPAEDSLGCQQVPPPTTDPEETNARVLDALARKSSNRDRPPDRDFGRKVREYSFQCNRPAREGRLSKVGASSLFLFLGGVPEVSTLPLIIDYPVILSASGPENPGSGLRNYTSRPQYRRSLPHQTSWQIVLAATR